VLEHNELALAIILLVLLVVIFALLQRYAERRGRRVNLVPVVVGLGIYAGIGAGLTSLLDGTWLLVALLADVLVVSAVLLACNWLRSLATRNAEWRDVDLPKVVRPVPRPSRPRSRAKRPGRASSGRYISPRSLK